MSDEKLRRTPLLRTLFEQWRDNRGALPPGAPQRPFSRAWEKLLADAGLVTAEQRREALRDADSLENARWIKTTRDRSRRYQIERIALPLAAEPRLRELFAGELPAPAASLDLASIAWEPELQFISAARVQVVSEDLIKLNEFFQNGGRERLLAPVKERSLQIFGDEKRLDALRATTLFRGDRLALAHLRCFAVAEPLGWLRGPCPDKPLLVVENAATFNSYAHWNSHAGEFSAIVYGGGNRFIDSVSRLAQIFAELGGPRRVLYFGDLDPAGLRIPYRAKSNAAYLRLPPVEPDIRSYQWLLGFASKAESAAADAILPVSAEIDWLGDVATDARNLFAAGRRLAQEHVGWEFLDSLSFASWEARQPRKLSGLEARGVEPLS